MTLPKGTVNRPEWPMRPGLLSFVPSCVVPQDNDAGKCKEEPRGRQVVPLSVPSVGRHTLPPPAPRPPGFFEVSSTPLPGDRLGPLLGPRTEHLTQTGTQSPLSHGDWSGDGHMTRAGRPEPSWRGPFSSVWAKAAGAGRLGQK